MAGVGIGAAFTAWPLLTSTLGPTAYVFVAHPGQEAPRLRDAAVGHSVGLAVGLVALLAFGLWQAPAATAEEHLPLAQAGAAAAAVAATLMALELLRSHHAPAAATALLVATGLARPGRPLLGLIIGLAVVLAVAPLVARIPLARSESREEQEASGSGSPQTGFGPPPAT